MKLPVLTLLCTKWNAGALEYEELWNTKRTLEYKCIPAFLVPCTVTSDVGLKKENNTAQPFV